MEIGWIPGFTLGVIMNLVGHRNVAQSSGASRGTDPVTTGFGQNRLPAHPVEFVNGYAVAPSRPGHGLDPSIESLRAFSNLRPE